MDRKLSFLVVGGDCRQNFLAGRLSKTSCEVYTLGVSDEHTVGSASRLESISQLNISPDVVVLPLTASEDGVNISAPFAKENITLASVANACGKNTLLTGGRLTAAAKAVFEDKNIPTADYFNREELIIKNCIPTAEGALLLAMENTAFTISQSNVMVLGFGRVAKATARIFASLGAKVHIAARKPSDLALAQTLGYGSCALSQLCETVGHFDIIINTIPALVLTEEILKNADKNVLIIDLASKPGGVDLSAAASLKLKVIWALSLPPENTLCEK